MICGKLRYIIIRVFLDVHFYFHFCKLLYFQLDLSLLLLKYPAPYFISILIKILTLIFQHKIKIKSLLFEIFAFESHILSRVKFWQNANFWKFTPLLYYQAIILRIFAENNEGQVAPCMAAILNYSKKKIYWDLQYLGKV